MLMLARLRLPVAGSAAVLLLAILGVSLLNAGPRQIAVTQPAAPTTLPAVVAEDTPRGVVAAAFRAATAGDGDGLIARFDNVTPAQAETLRQVAGIMSAADRLADAVKTRFGADMERQLTRAFGTGVAEADVAAATQSVLGDRAFVSMAAGPGEIPLVRSGPTWKIAARVLDSLNPNTVRQFAQRIPALEKLTADLRAGKYKTVDDLRQAMGGMTRPPRSRPATTATTAPARGA